MNIQWIGSPNYDKGRGGKSVSFIVVHHMAGTMAAADQVFQNTVRKTSAHYGVGRDGRIHQYVLDADTAFHSGVYDANQRSIGIEHEDLNADNYTDLQYLTSAMLIRTLCQKYGLAINANTIRGHRAFVPTACPGTLDISRLIQLAQGDVDMASKEYLIALYCLAFDCDDDQVNKDFVKAFTGKPKDEAATYLRQDASWLKHKERVNNSTGFVPVTEPLYRKQ